MMEESGNICRENKIIQEETKFLSQKIQLDNSNINDLFLMTDFLVNVKENQLKFKQLKNWRGINSESTTDKLKSSTPQKPSSLFKPESESNLVNLVEESEEKDTKNENR